jgi:anti-sigma factor RsiW
MSDTSTSLNSDGGFEITASAQAELNVPLAPPPSRDQLTAKLASLLLFGVVPAAAILVFAPLMPYAILAVAWMGFALYRTGVDASYLRVWLETEYRSALKIYESQWFCRACTHILSP